MTPNRITFQLQPAQSRAFTTRATEVLYGGAAGGGKALALDTPIATPSGWRMMGDLMPGDFVFDDCGQPRAVEAISETWENRRCYRLTFDDGATIVASAEHLWRTFDACELAALTRRTPEWRAARRARRPSRATGRRSKAFTASITARNKAAPPKIQDAPKGTIRTTAGLAASVRTPTGRANHAIPTPSPLALPQADLPVDPYALGFWLGDGTRGQGAITQAPEDMEQVRKHFEAAGFQVRKRSSQPTAWGILGLQKALRLAGWLHTRAIPPAYLRASEAQRLAMLQGLMDSDGSADENGNLEFTTTNASAADSFEELLASLGIKAHTSTGRAMLNGKDCGLKWRVNFTTTLTAFRLPRKAARQAKSKARRTSSFRYLVACDEIAPVPVRCIQVQGGMFLAGRAMIPTHNSFLMRVAAIAWCQMIPGLQVALFRRTYPDLNNNHMEGPSGFPAMLAPLMAAGAARIVAGEITFPNGSRIALCHCQYEKDKYRYQGAEFHVLMLDELTHFTETIYTFLRARVRMTGLQLPPHLRGLFPRILCSANPGGVGHCVRFGEVWTDAGWKDIWEVKPGDKVYSRDSDGRIVLKTVTQLHRHLAEKLLRYEARGLTIEATPEHKIGVMRGERFILTPLTELPGQAYIARSAKWDGGEGMGELKIPFVQTGRKSAVKQPLSVTPLQFAALAGWTMTEGCVGKYSSEWRWNIAQTKQPQRAKIKELLTECGFKFQATESGFTIASESWVKFWTAAKCRFKRVPTMIMQKANRAEIMAFIIAAVDGDGHWTIYGESGQFYTSSPGLADDFQELACKVGFATCLSHRERENRLGQSYCVNFKSADRTEILTGNHRYKVTTKTKRAKPAKEIVGRFEVACIGVEDTHNFFIRQNGSVWISGNSWVKRTFVNRGTEAQRMPDSEGGMTRQFIPAKLSDNPALLASDPTYAARLAGLGDPLLVRAMLDGDWNIVAGAMFGEVWRQARHTVRPFAIPADWPIWWGMDDGFSAPASIHFVTRDPSTTTIFVLGEIYRPQMLPAEIHARISRMSRNILLWHGPDDLRPHGEVAPGILDGAAFADTGQSTERGQKVISRGAQLRALGLKIDAAEKWPGSRIHRARELHRLLAPNPNDPRGLPGIRFFTTCEKAIETIPALPRDANNIEDVDTNAEDHCFIAGTKIATAEGEKAIENIREGDIVWTRNGLRPVVFVCPPRQAEVMELHCEERTLVGTPNHKIPTSQGKVELWRMTHSVTVYTWNQKSFQNAENPLPPFGQVLPACAAVPVLNESFAVAGEKKGLQMVYNFTVQDEHEYFANGLLVCNCYDSVTYALQRATRKFAQKRVA